jgi:glucokinase
MAEAVFAAVLTNRATHLDAALATSDGTIRWRTRVTAHAPLTSDEVVRQVVRLAHDVQSISISEGITITGGALALEATLTADQRTVLALPGVDGWEMVPLRDRLTTASGFPRGMAITTVTNAALLGEMTLGAGRGATCAVYLNLSRSVNAAFWWNGHIVQRPHLGALGHIPVAGATDRCACGGRGHLETVASAQALVRHMIGLLVEAPTTEAAVMRLTGGRAESLTAAQIWQLACEGDAPAAELMAGANAALADVTLTLLLSLDAERIILGGALARSGPTWRDALAAAVQRIAPPARADDLAARLTLGELGPGAILRGALTLATM